MRDENVLDQVELAAFGGGVGAPYGGVEVVELLDVKYERYDAISAAIGTRSLRFDNGEDVSSWCVQRGFV